MGTPNEPRASTFGLRGLLRVVGVVVLLAFGAVAARGLVKLRAAPFEWHTVQDATMEFLRQEQLLFLVTDRVVTRLDVSLKEGSLLMGWRESVLIGTVEFFCGIDLARIGPDALAWQDGTVVVTVPDPEVLKVAVDTGSLTLFSKRSGLIALRDQLSKRDVRAELERQLEVRARAFAREERLLPGRDDMVRRLNEWAAPLLAAQVNAGVRFR
ncbi:MAG: DUF4230 domain-containing protein [Candidatus Brocadiaceae bacterium]|nr:DUF4230 domain-containing protein [Candidatus Brocadiaceae bacterium]